MKYANKVILMVAVMLILFSHASLYPKADKDDDGQKKLYEYTVNGIDSPPSGDLAPYSVTFSSEKPFRVFIFRAITPGSQFLIYVVPDDYFDYAPITYVRTYDGNPLPTETVDHLANDHSFFCYGFVRGENASVDKPYQYFTARSEINQILNDYYNGNKDAYQPDTNLPPVDLEKEGTFSEDIPTPRLVFTEGLKFYINNASDDYGIEMQGCWWTVDDIELYKESLMWKYKYMTLLHNRLTTWVDVNERLPSRNEYDLSDLGADSFNQLLEKYPVDDRNYYGGSNAMGNYFSGYSDGLSTLKMLLTSKGTLYTSPEVYVRFYYEAEDGTIYYGRWCHWYSELAKDTGSSGSLWDSRDEAFREYQSDKGLTSAEKDNLSDSENSRVLDTDASSSDNSLFGLAGKIFSFLPWWCNAALGGGLVIVIICRILGR